MSRIHTVVVVHERKKCTLEKILPLEVFMVFIIVFGVAQVITRHDLLTPAAFARVRQQHHDIVVLPDRSPLYPAICPPAGGKFSFMSPRILFDALAPYLFAINFNGAEKESARR